MVSLEEESFIDQSYIFQSLLSFFIDGASVIEPSMFWKYFLVYEKKTQNIVAFTTVFESHQTAVRFRTRISQVIVFPPYQRRGIGSKMYEAIYQHYLNQQNCFQIIVEDAAEDFQKLQDIFHAQEYLNQNKALKEAILKQPASKVILSAAELRKLELNINDAKKFAKQMKLPEPIIHRVHELVLFSFLSDQV